MLVPTKKTAAPFVRYCVTGVLATSVDFLVLLVLREALAIALLEAVFWGFLVANTASFVINKYWTFKNRSLSLVRQYTKFVIVPVIGLLLTLFLMWLFAEQWQLFKDVTPRYYLICKGFTSGVVVLWNFLGNKLWVFAGEVRLHPQFYFAEQYPCFLSIVIPAYNEQERIVPTLRAIITYLKTRNLDGEILVVDDGSEDDTAGVCRQLSGEYSGLRIIRNPTNHGKGFAVKIGMQNAAGQYLLFTDADNSTPIEEFDNFLALLSEKRIVIGSRYLDPSSVERRQPWYRILISRAGNLLIQLFVVEGVQDTQCGFKVFHREVANFLSRLQRIDRFAFDIELLSLAQLSGIEIKEIAVRWLNSDMSRVRPIRDALRTFVDLLRIKFYIWSRRYSLELQRLQQHPERQPEAGELPLACFEVRQKKAAHGA